MNTRVILTSVFCLMLSLAAFGQRDAKVHGKYTHIVKEDESVTFAEAKRIAIANARAQAIKDEFGTLVTSDVISHTETDTENVKSKFWENTEIMAKGDWLGDTQPAEYNIEYDKDSKCILFTAEVWGHAREIVQAQVDFEWKILKDSPTSKSETLTFNNKDRIYIKFKSPVAGYLAIYLLEGSDEASCLLPYRDIESVPKVKGGTDYVFFDKTTDETAASYRLSTKSQVEDDQIVVIFSPNPFVKCIDVKSDPKRPNYINTMDFQKWLLKCQRRDKDMVVAKKWVRILNQD